MNQKKTMMMMTGSTIAQMLRLRHLVVEVLGELGGGDRALAPRGAT